MKKSLTALPQLLCVVTLTAAVLASSAFPASATEIDVPTASVMKTACGTLGSSLVPHLSVSPSVGGFTASADATLCNATGLYTVIQMTFGGAGNSVLQGGLIAAAPFAVQYGNYASVQGTSLAPSETNQTVLVNVVATSVTVGAEYQVECQAVVELFEGYPIIVKGC